MKILSLRGTVLIEVKSNNLRWADLQEANLRLANLRGANLQRANLQGADLRGANLREANLRLANLQGANLQGVDLRGAELQGAFLPYFQIPEGQLIGWKKVKGRIIRLSIPSAANRTASLVGRKCRAEYAICKEIEGAETVETRGLVYRPGKKMVPDRYDDDPRVECTHGIHFFLTRQEAENWY